MAKFAVFIDLENCGAKVATLDSVLEKVKIRGDILLGKVYGYTDRFSDLKEVLLSNTFTVVPSLRYGIAQKNNADIQLVIDALEVAYTNELIDSFCIVSGDSDYTPLVGRLKSMGKFVLGMNPSAMGLLKSPREQGADIAVGEAQPLGLPMSFGGPYIGFMATTQKEMRKMPGRIVGETVDSAGNRAYVLTLQAREQHIRRERATSNICSNQALCALTVSVYLASVGSEGLRHVARACTSNAHYLANGLVEKGAKLCFNGEFFHEFVTLTEGKAEEIITALKKENILGGLLIDADTILWCCTEKATKESMDKVIEIVGGVL